MLALGNQVRMMGFFGRQIIAKPVSFLVGSDAGPPLVLKPNHAKKTRFVAPIWSANVLRVAAQVNDTQIAQSIVSFSPVDVVNKTVRPDAMRMKPRKSVRFVDFLFYAYSNVAKFVGIARNVANVHGFARPCNPSKNSGVVVVMKKLTNFFSRDAINHAGFPFVRHNVNAGIIA